MSGIVKLKWPPASFTSPIAKPLGLWSGLKNSPVSLPSGPACTLTTTRSTLGPATSTPCQPPVASWAAAGVAIATATARAAK